MSKKLWMKVSSKNIVFCDHEKITYSPFPLDHIDLCTSSSTLLLGRSNPHGIFTLEKCFFDKPLDYRPYFKSVDPNKVIKKLSVHLIVNISYINGDRMYEYYGDMVLVDKHTITKKTE